MKVLPKSKYASDYRTVCVLPPASKNVHRTGEGLHLGGRGRAEERGGGGRVGVEICRFNLLPCSAAAAAARMPSRARRILPPRPPPPPSPLLRVLSLGVSEGR